MLSCSLGLCWEEVSRYPAIPLSQLIPASSSAVPWAHGCVGSTQGFGGAIWALHREPQIPAVSWPWCPPERLRLGTREDQDKAELCVGEAAGKAGISMGLLCPQGCGMCCSWVLPGALGLGWRLPKMWKRDISPQLILLPLTMCNGFILVIPLGLGETPAAVHSGNWNC